MKKKIRIEGMSCEHFIKNVEEALSAISNVLIMYINMDDDYIIISTNGNIDDSYIKYSIDDAGYRVVSIESL